MEIYREHVKKVYNEIERRLEGMVRNGYFGCEEEVGEARKSMLQGVYCTFMMISDNWPDVRLYCDLTERELGY